MQHTSTLRTARWLVHLAPFKEITVIKQFDKSTCRQLAEELKIALQAVAKKHGLTLETAGGRFTPIEYTGKLKWTVGDKSVVAARAKEQWDEGCRILGLKPSDFGREVHSRGQIWRVCGLNPRRSRYPILAQDINGRRLKLSVGYLIKR